MIKYKSVYKLTKNFMTNIYELKIFNWIERDIIDTIIKNSKEISFKKWEKVIKEWEISNWEWYIIKNWTVEVIINEKFITDLKSWDIFWEIALLNEETRTATVKAITDLDLIVLSLDSLIEIINNDTNKINKEILRRIEENLGDKNLDNIIN